MPDEHPAIRTDDYSVVPIDSVEPHPRNVNEGDVGAIVESIDALGFYGACLVQRSTSRIIAGKHRWLAARDRGMTEIPVLWLDVTNDEAERIMLSDNRIARLGRDDDVQLLELLTELRTRDSLPGTGFHDDDIEDLRRFVEFSPPLDPAPVPPSDGAFSGRVCVSCTIETYRAWRALVERDGNDESASFQRLVAEA